MVSELTVTHEDNEQVDNDDDANREVFHLEDAPEFWQAFLTASIGMTIVILVTKVVLTIAYGFWSGFEIEMNRIFQVIPQFVFGRSQETFEHMVRASWVLSSCGAVVWWLLRSVGIRGERREIEGMSQRAKDTDREREELRYGIFVAEARRIGSWIGMWCGSLGLLGILGFEYVRTWLIDDVAVPSFPLWVWLVAIVPVVMLAQQWTKRSDHQTLVAEDVASLFSGDEPTSESTSKTASEDGRELQQA